MRVFIVSHFITGHRNRTPSWMTLVLWVTSTIMGGLVFYFLTFQAILVLRIPIDAPEPSLTEGFTELGALAGALGGVVVGLAQWRILRGSVMWAGSWARAIILGWAIGGALCGLLAWLLYDKDTGDVWFMGRYVNIGWLIAGIAGGLGIGLGEWLILHRRIPIWWFLLTTLTWVVIWTLVFVLGTIRLVMAERLIIDDSDLILFWIATGTVYGIVTRLALNARISKASMSMPKVVSHG
jgi:hypothetical protein